MMIRDCVICGREFLARTCGKCCSDECKHENAKQYQLQWRSKNREHYRSLARAERKRAYAKDPIKFIKRTRDYESKNPEKRKEYRLKRNPEIHRNGTRRYKRNKQRVSALLQLSQHGVI